MTRCKNKLFGIGALFSIGAAHAAVVAGNGCISCHSVIDAPTMHLSEAVHLSCTDCHGGDANVQAPQGEHRGQAGYDRALSNAHPRPMMPGLWKSSANPVRATADWQKEGDEYIRFVNPGDLRVVAQTCGRPGCHTQE